MKRILLIIAALLCTTLMSSDDDKPRTQRDELLKTIQRAEKKQTPYELLDACLKYEKVVRSINWKEAEAARKFVDETLQRYVAGHSAAAYPIDAYLDYEAVKYGDESALRAYMQKYAGRAMALRAEAELLRMEFHELGDKASSDDYLKFRGECVAFEERRAAFKGAEALVAGECDRIGKLLEQMDAKAISFSAGDDRMLTIRLRNLNAVTVRLAREGAEEILWEESLSDPKDSYYIYDTLRLQLPDIADGEYSLTCTSAEVKASSPYTQYSLSVAYRREGENCAIYAAWYMDGKPVETADLQLKDSKSGEVREYKDFRMKGFTPLPEEIAAMLKDGRKRLRLSLVGPDGLKRSSNGLLLPTLKEDAAGDRKMTPSAKILMDRGAYNPGDTIRFKAVVYESDIAGSQQLLEQGRKVQVNLYDAKGRKFKYIELKTNEYSSVNGYYVLPEKLERNGSFSISVSIGERETARRYFVVDDFVLPTYFIDFHENEDIYFPGDTVSVMGNVRAYSGHSLNGAAVLYSVTGGDFEQKGEPALSGEGDFSFNFVAPKQDGVQWLKVSLRVVSPTGETQERDAWQLVSDELRILAEMDEEAAGRVDFQDSADYQAWESVSVLKNDTANIRLRLNNYHSDAVVPGEMEYRLESVSGEMLDEGRMDSGDTLNLDLKGRKSGLYRLNVSSSYLNYKGEEEQLSYSKKLLLLNEGDRALDCPDLAVAFREFAYDEIKLQVAATTAPIWAVVELSDTDKKILKSEIIYLHGVNDGDGSLETIEYDYLESYGDRLTLSVFYFRDGRAVTYRKNCRRPQKKYLLPLEFTRFEDRTTPRSRALFSLKTAPGVEAVLSVFDKSTETINLNEWSRIQSTDRTLSYDNIYERAGGAYSYGFDLMTDDEVTVTYQMAESKPRFGFAMKSALDADSANSYPDEAVNLRSDFRNTLAFMPCLRSDKDGVIDFEVKTADKLSTYYVQVFAHDKAANSAVLRREMQLSLPMQLSVLEPSLLYEGDVYLLKPVLSNTADYALGGRLYLQVYDTEDYKSSEPMMSLSRTLSVPANGTAAGEFEIEVPSGVSVLGFKLVYVADVEGAELSDGLFVSTPVKRAVQSITESHSALLLNDADMEALKSELAARFVNSSSASVEDYREISLMDILRNAVPEMVRAGENDVLSLFGAYYMNVAKPSLMPEREALNAEVERTVLELEKKILACHNADGGFAWFEGFRSSPVLTAVILEYFSLLSERAGCREGAAGAVKPGYGGELYDAMLEAVGYIDNQRICRYPSPVWRGGLSLEQYLYVRVRYPQVAFEPDCDKENLEIYLEDIKEWLLDRPSSELNLFSKVRRASVLLRLCPPESHPSLSESLPSPSESLPSHPELGSGFALSTKSEMNLADRLLPGIKARKIQEAASKAMASLLEYAVPHASGGIYYPNVVMPYRGLLESEVYAHTMICDLMQDYGGTESLAVAEGIRLWLLLQKETQDWRISPAYLNAVHSVSEGSESVRNARIAVMSRTAELPFSEVKAGGNGFSLERRFFLQSASAESEAVELHEGDSLRIGDRIYAEYRIWSEDNRSFVKLAAPRNAALRPVEQLSGTLVERVSLSASRAIYRPYIYRDVKSDVTTYYMDVCPEEESCFREEFFVTAAGRFSAPAVTVESSYAPHYRANTDAPVLLSGASS